MIGKKLSKINENPFGISGVFRVWDGIWAVSLGFWNTAPLQFGSPQSNHIEKEIAQNKCFQIKNHLHHLLWYIGVKFIVIKRI